jgi:hypothetical protein
MEKEGLVGLFKCLLSGMMVVLNSSIVFSCQIVVEEECEW